MFRARAGIGKVATTTARDQNLATRFAVMLQQNHAPTALRGRDGAHKPGRPGPKNDCVKLLRQALG